MKALVYTEPNEVTYRDEPEPQFDAGTQIAMSLAASALEEQGILTLGGRQMTGAQLKEVLEDVADNLFYPDPYYQQGGDMVRTGGLGYAIDVSKKIGERITNMVHLKSGQPIDAGKEYVVAGWASVNQGTEGPPIWDVIAKHIEAKKTVKANETSNVKIAGA